ncbi:MAG: hypothetical protein ABSG53_15710 [Thermoguttaceae bacterium]
METTTSNPAAARHGNGRHGDDYLLYKKNVPRWIPKLTPWKGLSNPVELEKEGDLP